MPHTAIMQGFSTLFATVMTFTVITFPTPRDLYDTVFPPTKDGTAEVISGGVVPDLPKASNDLDPAALVADLSACVDSLSAAIPFGVETCRQTIRLSGIIADRDPTLAGLRERMELATAYLCRVEWVESNTVKVSFDLDSCEGVAVALAD